jgi:predicted nucleic acid-binding protein
LFLDANVIFTAAHNPNGNSRALFKLGAQQRVELISSRYALEEAARNIAVKFPECVAEFHNIIAGLVLVAEPSKAESQLAAAQDLPGKDVPILAAAIGAGASSRHRRPSDFGHLYGKTVEGTTVLTPAEALSRALRSLVAR